MTHIARRQVAPPKAYVDRRSRTYDVKRTEFVDFSSVPPEQTRIHRRLENWARWQRNAPERYGKASSPMFDLYRSSDARREYGTPTVVPVDAKDATILAMAVGRLSMHHRVALHWYYLKPKNPSGKARELGVEIKDLAGLVVEARAALIETGE